MKININNTKYLNTEEDIKHKDLVTLLDGGRWEESTRFKRKDGTPANTFKIQMELANGEARDATLNWTNVKLLVQAFGDESESWANKKVRAWKTKSEKAKSGFTFYFVPEDWEKDDTGEWVIPEGSQVQIEKKEPTPDQKKTEDIDTIEYPEADIDPADIPF
jgi:hypothetical protein